jgi:adenosylcobinamide-GDP ribazoletransferase
LCWACLSPEPHDPNEKIDMSDTLNNATENNNTVRPFAELLLSLSFLTRLPIPFLRTLDLPPLANAMRFFAVAGALIGFVTAGILHGLVFLHVPSFLAAIITCSVIALLTGALHEDGLSDSFDGLFGGKTRERRLEIMRDSRIGTYGAIALGLAILMRVGAFESLIQLPFWKLTLILSASAAFSRAMMVDLMWASKAARSDGLSNFAGRPSRNTALFAISTGGALALCAGLHFHGVIAILAAAAITGLFRRLATRLIGGQTGDICGAVQVLSELAMLTVYASTIH